MNGVTDQQLLRDYAEHRSEAAFAELVHRHVDLVDSAAVRMVCDSRLAQDVAQGALVALAQNAPQLTDRPVLSGWLHRTARNSAAKTVRSDVCRRTHEQEAAAITVVIPANAVQAAPAGLAAGFVTAATAAVATTGAITQVRNRTLSRLNRATAAASATAA